MEHRCLVPGLSELAGENPEYVLEVYPVWVAHRIPRPNVEPSMRLLQQEFRRLPLARSEFFAWAWDRPRVIVPIESTRGGYGRGRGGKGRTKGLTVDDLMLPFVREAPHGLWAAAAMTVRDLKGERCLSQAIVRAALRRAVMDWRGGHPVCDEPLGGTGPLITDLELLERLAPVVIPANAGHQVLTLATVMG